MAASMAHAAPSPAAGADAAFVKEVLAELWTLSADATKTDSLATQITGWLQHTDFAQIKASAEAAQTFLRSAERGGRGGVQAVRSKVSGRERHACRVAWRAAGVRVNTQCTAGRRRTHARTRS